MSGRDNGNERQLVRTGRPTSVEDAGAKVIAAISNGADRASASGYAGVPYGTLRSWLSRGRDGLEPYASFLRDFETAEAEAAVRMAKVVFDAAQDNKDFRAALEWLRRRRPDHWGDPQIKGAQASAQASVVLVQLGDGAPRSVQQLTDEELIDIERRLTGEDE